MFIAPRSGEENVSAAPAAPPVETTAAAVAATTNVNNRKAMLPEKHRLCDLS
jgi:hypothetical protein